MILMRFPVRPEKAKAAKVRKVGVKVKERVSEIRPASLLTLPGQKVFATCMRGLENVRLTTVLILTCPKIKSSVHLVREGTRSETRHVTVMIAKKALMGVEKDVAKAKAKAKIEKDLEASLRAPGMATQHQLKLLFNS